VSPTTWALATAPQASETEITWAGDPGTPEEDIVAAGIHDSATLAAVLARASKGPTLIAALIDGVSLGRRPYPYSDTDAAAMLAGLLDEPAINATHLTCMARVVVHELLGGASLLTAICVRGQLSRETLIWALWNADPQVSADVANTTKALLPTVVNWVARQCGRDHPMRYAGDMTRAQQLWINATETRWTRHVATEPALGPFLRASSGAFNDEATMFAAGRAVTSPAADPRVARTR